MSTTPKDTDNTVIAHAFLSHTERVPVNLSHTESWRACGTVKLKEPVTKKCALSHTDVYQSIPSHTEDWNTIARVDKPNLKTTEQPNN